MRRLLRYVTAGAALAILVAVVLGFGGAALIAADADVLVTHETTKAMQTGVTSLALHYEYRLSLTTSGQQLRTVIWSKFPMSAGALMLEDQIEPTGAMAMVDLGGGREALIVGLHLAHSAVGNQEVQIRALGTLLDGRPHPRILLGDFNATPWSWAMHQVAELSETQRVPGYRITWAGAYPSFAGDIPAPIGQPIDHILVSPDMGVQSVETLDIPGSDHLAVKATLLIP
ncbi:MAG: endonuclease/exonuclease/phosphatase family protein [Pseudomonadota bacterium]